MRDRLLEALEGRADNYILPFLWMHGDNGALLREYMGHIQASGIHAVCVESRPHPDFAGEGWWQDLDQVVEEARRRSMRVWILDDDRFPTGHAAGRVIKEPSHLRRWSLVQDCIDVAGPIHGARFAVGKLMERLAPPPAAREITADKRLVAVIACRCKRSSKGELEGERINLTGKIDENGYLYWNVPEGAWRVVVVAAMTNACAACNDYVDFLQRDSVKLLLEAVYEPHFQRYHADFGGVIAGFFSDEPGFYTGTSEMYPLEEKIGQRDLPLPWCGEIPLLLEKAGVPVELLPLLWYEGDNSARVRHRYMDILTSLYQKNYVQQVGDWCEAHGVEYTGHVLEDNNCHARLGAGPGHYFRAMEGQHMAGIDVVFNQIFPGRDFEETCHRVMDGEFNQFVLAKLASSSAHLEPRMAGRALAELFGACGWAEGLPVMKWVVDSLLVRGINTFVPHAFSPKAFPDPDCPPHFYAGGNNPQFPYMKLLFEYMNRAAHLLRGGRAVLRTAILYHGQAEWCGETMLVQTPARICAENQADFDVISEDHLLESDTCPEGFQLRGNLYRLLIVPGCRRLPGRILAKLVELNSRNTKVVFLGERPAVLEPELAGTPVEDIAVITTDALPSLLADHNCQAVRTATPCPELRCVHYRQQQRDVFLLFNEGLERSIQTDITLPAAGPLVGYNCMENELYALTQRASGSEIVCSISLEAYESMFVVAEPPALPTAAPIASAHIERVLIEPWEVILCGTGESFSLPELKSIASPELYPKYSGMISYSCTFDWHGDDGEYVLSLGELYEPVEVILNGQPIGRCIAPPYRFALKQALQSGSNDLEIRTATTLYNRMEDALSLRTPLFPTGLIGPVCILA